MRILTAVLGLAVVAVQSASAAPGPCDLVTQAEMQAAVGSPVSAGAINKLNKAVCDYKVGDSGSLVNVTLTPKSPADSAERTVAELKKRNISATVVAGIGDGAYASSPGFGMQQLGAYKGSSHVIVTALLTTAPEAKTKAAIQAVMRKALAKVQ